MGFGASFVALFAQLGGGIYTKAADVGADLVGKVEAGIPEDDPRNAAVIADLVGDNVGDCAGRGADLFESTVAENIGAMILGVALAVVSGNNVWIFFPFVIRSFGLIISIVGVIATTSLPGIRYKEGEEPTNALYRGFGITVFLSALVLAVVTYQLLGSWWFVLAGIIGLLNSIAFVVITMYYTEGRFRPVRDIVRASFRGDGPEHYHRFLGRSGKHGAPRDCRRRSPYRLVLVRHTSSRPVGTGTICRRRVCNRCCDDGHVDDRRVCVGNGYVGSDRGQCRRHRRNVRCARTSAARDGCVGRRRQYDQGIDQGLCDWFRRPRRVLAL